MLPTIFANFDGDTKGHANCLLLVNEKEHSGKIITIGSLQMEIFGTYNARNARHVITNEKKRSSTTFLFLSQIGLETMCAIGVFCRIILLCFDKDN